MAIPKRKKDDTSQDDPKDKKDDQTEELGKKILTGFEQLAGVVGKMGEVLNSMSSRLETVEKGQTQSSKKDDEEDDDDLGEQDLEGMTRGQFVEYLRKDIGKTVSKFVKPVAEHLSTKEVEEKKEKMKAALESVAKDHKDFWQWREELKAYYKKHPDADPEDAYFAVRRRNTKKAEELDKKLKADADKAKEEEDKRKEEEAKGKARPPKFGGFPPSTPGKSTKTQKAEFPDAAETAWEESIAKTGYDPSELLEG